MNLQGALVRSVLRLAHVIEHGAHVLRVFWCPLGRVFKVDYTFNASRLSGRDRLINVEGKPQLLFFLLGTQALLAQEQQEGYEDFQRKCLRKLMHL
jgi:hypothetical protein